MEGSKRNNDAGVAAPKLWITRSMYALDEGNKYFEILTYRSGEGLDSSVGQIRTLDSKPDTLYSSCFICTGTKPIIPIDNTRCGFSHSDGKIVFLKEITRGRLARVCEKPQDGKKYRFLFLSTVDYPAEIAGSGGDEIFSKHFTQFDSLKISSKRSADSLPRVGSIPKTVREPRPSVSSADAPPTIVTSDPKPSAHLKPSKPIVHLDTESVEKSLYKAFLNKCAVPMKLETVSITPENTSVDPHLGNVEDMVAFKLLLAHLEENEKISLNVEIISSLEFIKTALSSFAAHQHCHSEAMQPASW